MKKLMFTTLFLVFLLGIWSSNAGASIATLWWDVKGITDKSATQPPGPGDLIPDTKVDLLVCQKVWLDLYVSGILPPGAVNFAFNLNYDSEQFTYEPPNHPSLKVGEIWSNLDFRYVDVGNGYIIGEGAMPMSGVKEVFGDNIEIAMIDFHCKRVGSYTLNFEEFGLWNMAGNSYDLGYIPLTINNVPIPGALLLLGSGLLGILGLRRKIRG